MSAQNNSTPVHAEGMDIVDILAAIVRQRKVLLIVTSVVTLGALVISLLMTPVFTSTARILPPQQQASSLAAALGSLGVLAGAAGGMAGIKNPNDLYVGMLQSQSVADVLIEKFDLKARYEVITMVDARLRLADSVAIEAGKDGIITISVDDPDPRFAATLANAYVEQLRRLNQTLAVTDAGQRRAFFENQLVKVKKDLSKAEVNFQQIQRKTNIIAPEGQAVAVVTGVAELKAQIAAKEVQLNVMRSTMTDSNPDFVRIKSELIEMKNQLGKVERKGAEKAGDITEMGQLSDDALLYYRALRDVKYQEMLFELMSKQFELAKVDESKDSSLIQVLDVAKPSDKKSKPKRATIVVFGFMLGLIVGIIASFVSEQRRIAKECGQNGRWATIGKAWRGED